MQSVSLVHDESFGSTKEFNLRPTRCRMFTPPIPTRKRQMLSVCGQTCKQGRGRQSSVCTSSTKKCMSDHSRLADCTGACVGCLSRGASIL